MDGWMDGWMDSIIQQGGFPQRTSRSLAVAWQERCEFQQGGEESAVAWRPGSWPVGLDSSRVRFSHPPRPLPLASLEVQLLLPTPPCSHPQSSLPAGGTTAAATHSTTGKMSACGRKALTLLSSIFAVCGLGLLGIAVSTDYWLYLEEGVVRPQNQSTEIKMSLHSGLWRVCFLAGKGTRGFTQLCPQRSSPTPWTRSSPPPPLGRDAPAGRRWFTWTILMKPG